MEKTFIDPRYFSKKVQRQNAYYMFISICYVLGRLLWYDFRRGKISYEFYLYYVLPMIVVALVGMYLYMNTFFKSRSREFWVKITGEGLVYHYFRKEVQARWNQIQKVRVSTWSAYPMISLKADSRSFRLPLRMVDQSGPVPELVGLTTYKFLWPNGEIQRITAENSPLVIELKRHLPEPAIVVSRFVFI